MLTPSVLAKADAYWARDFGRWPVELRPSQTRVQAHAGELSGNEGIWILAVGKHPLISIPPKLAPDLEDRLKTWSRALVQDPAAIRRELHPRQVTRLIGPAFIGYVMPDTLVAPSGPSARPLAEEDRDAVEQLRASCSAEEWDNGGSPSEDVPRFGAFDPDGRLGAVASYEVWNRRLAHIRVISAPDRRSSGFASAVVGLAAQTALEAELVPQYRTLASNKPSMRVAEKLGFEEYGFSVYLKIAG